MGSNQRILVDKWTVQARVPGGMGPSPVFILLHGWTGDEDAMGVFTPRLPKRALLLAPRGLYEAGPGGYSWYKEQARGWPRVEDFTVVVDRLLTLLNPAIFPQGDFGELHLVGFSQGAAAAYAFTLLHPERVTSTAGLAGFMPNGVEMLVTGERLKGLPVFITHGTRDVLVPVERARAAVKMFEEGGATVTYCEHDVGHKLNAACYNGLEAFYKGIIKVNEL